ARLVVFPIKGKNWCFSRSIDHYASKSTAANTPSTVKELWKKMSSNSKQPLNANAELLVDFVSNKMNKAGIGLEKAPEGSFKNKLHGFRVAAVSRVKPSEIFLKSITKDVTNTLFYSCLVSENMDICRDWTTLVQCAFQITRLFLMLPTLRHIALRGRVIHRKYYYGSVSLLPLTTAFTVLPLPNVLFFWVLFRTYSHWQAFKGSEKLLQLDSDYSIVSNLKENESEHNDSKYGTKDSSCYQWVLEPSKELTELLRGGAILDICI
ncbi:hypothetical protein ES288_A10G056800v1, partial [Gossypium darwinii]